MVVRNELETIQPLMRKFSKVKLNLHGGVHSALRLVSIGALYLKKLVASRIFMNIKKPNTNMSEFMKTV